MSEKGLECLEAVAHASRAPRKVDDQAAATEPGFTSGEHGHWSRGETGAAERFRHADRRPIDHGACGLGRLVPRREAGASGGEDDVEVAGVRPGQESGNNCGRAVRNHGSTRNLVPGLLAPGADEGSATVLRFAPGATIAHRQDTHPK